MASAMAYLHSRNVVHGDLCGSNVMLTTDKSKPAGFTSKVRLCCFQPPAARGTVQQCCLVGVALRYCSTSVRQHQGWCPWQGNS